MKSIFILMLKIMAHDFFINLSLETIIKYCIKRNLLKIYFVDLKPCLEDTGCEHTTS